MKAILLICASLFASNLCANRCESWFYGDSHGRGVIRVQAEHGKLDTHKVEKAMAEVRAGLNPTEWETLPARLQTKLGDRYTVIRKPLIPRRGCSPKRNTLL